jgi:hypothetical protein
VVADKAMFGKRTNGRSIAKSSHVCDISLQGGSTMPDEPVPMLNQPKESTCEAAEKFAENVLGRMSRTHESFTHLNDTLAEPPEEARKRLEKFREEAFARIEGITGLTFDRETGQCTTPMEERGDARQARTRWKRVCESQDLLREAGRIVRGETDTPEDPHG